jgi:hypothetical protein
MTTPVGAKAMNVLPQPYQPADVELEIDRISTNPSDPA